MIMKSLSVLLLAALFPHHCDHPHPPWGAGGTSSTGGSSGTAGAAGSGGTGGLACPDSATVTFHYVSGSFGPLDEPWAFTWPQPEDPHCDAQWERDEVTCVVTVDQTCLYEDVNVGPGAFVDELNVRSAAIEMVDGGEGFYSIDFTQTRQSDGVSFTDDGDYDLTVTVP